MQANGDGQLAERDIAALARARLIKSNLDLIHSALRQYKAYLNALAHDSDG